MAENSSEQRVSRKEVILKLLSGAVSGSVIGYIASVLPLLTGGDIDQQRASFAAILPGVTTGALAGCALGALFVYSSARLYSYMNDVEYIDATYKDIFYDARDGSTAPVLRTAFSKEFLHMFVACSADLCTAFKQGATPDKSQRIAAKASARLLRTIEAQLQRSDAENIDISTALSSAVHSDISADEMARIIFVSHGVMLRSDELERFYAINFPGHAINKG